MRMPDSTTSLQTSPGIFPKPPVKEAATAPSRKIETLESVYRHRYVAGAVLVVCLLASILVMYLRRGPWYETDSLIYVSPTPSKTLAAEDQQAAPYDGLIEEQMKTLTRFDVLHAALASLPSNIGSVYGNPETAPTALGKLLKVARNGDSFEIKVSLKSRDPRAAAAIVNAVTSSYIASWRHQHYFDRDQKLATLRQEENRLQSQLNEKESEQNRLLKQLGIGSIGAKDTSPYNFQLGKLQEDLNAAREESAVAESKLEALRSGGPNAPGLQVAAREASATDPAMVSLKQTLIAQRGSLTQQMSTLTPANPIYKQDEDQIRSIDTQIAQMTQSLQQRNEAEISERLRTDIEQKHIVVNRLERQLMEQTKLAAGTAPQYQQAQQISNDIENLQNGYAVVEDRIRQLQVDGGAPGSVYVTAAARVPLSPAPSKAPLLALALLVFSIGASVGTAVALDYFDPHLYNASDVQQVMGFAPLGLLLDHDHYSAEVTQQYVFRLAAGIHHAVKTAGAKTFLFTSTQPECGTTTIVEKLARQMRLLNLRTLTVAATNVDGKISYVSSSGETKRPAPQSETPSSGTLALAPHFGETSQAMFSGSFVAQVLSENQETYDVILVDGGPILISADTEYLARIADGTILIAQSGRTTRRHLERAAALLERLHVPGVAIALNRIQPQWADSALRKDVEDFQQQLRKQRGTSLTRQYTRRLGVERPQPVEVTEPVSTAKADAAETLEQAPAV